MHVDLMKLCSRVVAPKSTYSIDVMTFNPSVKSEVTKWLEEHQIWDWELIGEDDGDHGPLYVFYFVNECDAILFSLRWLS